MARRFHLIIDAVDCEQKFLTNKTFLTQTIKKIAQLLEMEIIKGPVVVAGTPQNPGLTAFAIIDFSHISIHTFTQTNEFCLDIFSCKKFDYELLKKFVKQTFNLKPVQIKQTIVRYNQAKTDH